VPAIVPVELWEAAQAKHGTRKFGIGRPWHRPYLLSGMIGWARCGKRFQAQKQVSGRIPAYYVCGGYLSSGPSVCDGLRIAVPYLEEAVVDGVAKRIGAALDRGLLHRRLTELLQAEQPAGDLVALLEAELAEARQKIDRLVDALTAGTDDVPAVRVRLVQLERERVRLEGELGRARAKPHGPKDLDSAVEALIDALGRFREVRDAGEPEERKAVIRAFLQEIRIEKTTRQAVLRWYRLPRVDLPVKLVELRWFEPLTTARASGRA
jgi:recombinase-like zinc beta ribbon protein